MKTLVTGATGFVGRALVAALRARGDTVRALVRRSSDAKALARLRHLGAETRDGDVEDEASIARAAAGVEVIFHAAGYASLRGDKKRHEAVNLIGTENALGAAKTAGVRRLVHVSSAGVTKSMRPRSYVHEDLPQPPSFLDAYCETKALAEDLVIAANGGAFETVTLRPAWIWGPDDTTLLPTFIRPLREGRFVWIDGGQSLVATSYIRSVTDALLLAAKVPEAAGRVYYITDDERVTAREFLTQLFGAVSLTPPRRSLPLGVAATVAWVAEKLMRNPPFTRSEVASLGVSAHFNIQRARKELGYAPALTIAEGMERLRAWVKARGVDAIERGEITETPPES